MPTQITQILAKVSAGGDHAFSDLVPLVYDQMRQIAAGALRREPESECDPTELVHEAYIRLIGNEQLAWESRTHFYAACALVIRRLLVDQARARKRLKRGGEARQSDLEIGSVAEAESKVDLVELDDALLKLETLSERQSKIVELRFFGGMTEDEIAKFLDVSRRTVSNDWAMAKAWLKKSLS